jgi:hypothetical protein
MRRALKIFLILFGTLAATAVNNSAGISQQSQRLIEPGEFHGEEISAQSGEKWLGLHITDENSMLLIYRLKVDAVHDLVVDEEGQATGKRVAVDLPLEPLFLIKGVKNVSAGPVTTAFRDNGVSAARLDESSPMTVTLGETTYVLKVTGSEDTAKCPYQSLPRNARLVLVNGESRQVLYSLQDCGSDPSWSLVWAGDLDRDGKLDLYLDVTQHYNVSERKLFLSSPAGEGRLVKEVAEFVRGGC